MSAKRRAGALAAAVGAWLACAADPQPAPRPDRVVLVTIDTLRADRLGSYGHAGAHTPHLDALAERGARFETVVSPVPLTLPAHASLLTGLDPPRHGVRHNGVHRLPDDLATLAEGMRDSGHATAAFVGARVLAARYGLARGFDHYDDRGGSSSGAAVGWAERRAGEVVDAALAWLDSAPPRFFLWVHVYDPHARYAPPPGFLTGFAERPYDGEIAYVDHSLGRLFEALGADASDLLVAVTSDHGESLGEHGEPTHSYGVYDATQRVPLLLAGPGVPVGVVVRPPVRLVDLAPTLLEAVDAEPLADIDGESLWGLVHGEDDAPRLAYVETLATHLDLGWSPLVGLRSAGWKYVRAPRPELYDLATDPDEQSALDPAPEVRAEWEARLSRRLARERPAESAGPLDVAERLRLQSLGYVAGGKVAATSRATGPDPKDERRWLMRLDRAERLAEGGDPAAGLAVLGSETSRALAVLSLRAVLSLAAQRPEQASSDARAALSIDPARADLWVLLGRAKETLGERGAARRAYGEALALDSDSMPAREGLARTGSGPKKPARRAPASGREER